LREPLTAQESPSSVRGLGLKQSRYGIGSRYRWKRIAAVTGTRCRGIASGARREARREVGARRPPRGAGTVWPGSGPDPCSRTTIVASTAEATHHQDRPRCGQVGQGVGPSRPAIAREDRWCLAGWAVPPPGPHCLAANWCGKRRGTQARATVSPPSTSPFKALSKRVDVESGNRCPRVGGSRAPHRQRSRPTRTRNDPRTSVEPARGPSLPEWVAEWGYRDPDPSCRTP
jgi:hypothetical protein